MAKVSINKSVPDFTLTAFDGKEVKISNFVSKKHVLLVFNRGFA